MVASIASTAGCGNLGPGSATAYAVLDTARPSPTDDRVLVVSGIHGACDTVGTAEVVESADRVEVRVPLEVEPGACRAIGLLLRVSVELDAPLGDRVVVDRERDQVLPADVG